MSDEVDRARALSSLGRHEDAVAELRRVVAGADAPVEALCLLSLALHNLNRHEDALAAADRAVAADPNLEWPHRLRALALLGLRRRRAALEAATRAVRLRPDLPEAQYVLVRARLANHRRKAAAEAARQCLTLAPGSKLGHSAEVLVLIKSRRWPEAEAACRRALAIDPEDYAARHNLGIAVARQGRTVEGVGHLVVASKLNPASGSARRLAVVFGRVHAMRAPMAACLAFLLFEVFVPDAAGSTTFPFLLAGLVAFVVVHRRRRLAVLPAGVAELVQLADRRVSRRFGRLAFWAAVAVAISGAIIAVGQEPRAGIFLVVAGAGLAAVTRRVTAPARS